VNSKAAELMELAFTFLEMLISEEYNLAEIVRR
jgi:hypothetical protein